MYIPPELIDAALAFVATLVSCLAAYLNKEKNKAKKEKNEEKQKNADLLDLMISEKPITEGQQKVLDTTPEIEKTFTMSAETESTVYNLLKAAKPSLERGAFNAQITATKSQKLLSYALIAAKDYNDETPAAAVFIDYGLIRSIGTAREIHNTAVIQGAPEIYL